MALLDPQQPLSLVLDASDTESFAQVQDVSGDTDQLCRQMQQDPLDRDSKNISWSRSWPGAFSASRWKGWNCDQPESAFCRAVAEKGKALCQKVLSCFLCAVLIYCSCYRGTGAGVCLLKKEMPFPLLCHRLIKYL